MCIPDQRCIRSMIETSLLAALNRKAQAEALQLSRTSFMTAMAGKPTTATNAAIAAAIGSSVDEVAAACAVQGCSERRPPRAPGAYGSAVGEAARTAGLTLAELQRRSGVDRSSFFAAVSGTMRPREVHVRRVAAACATDPAPLLEIIGRSPAAATSPARARPAVPASGEFGGAVLSWMVTNGSNAAEFGRLVGASRQSVGMWVRGRTRPVGGRYEVIAPLLGLSVETLAEMLRRDADAQLDSRRTGRSLRAVRTSLGLTRTAAAKLLGITVTALRTAETGRGVRDEMLAMRDRLQATPS